MNELIDAARLIRSGPTRTPRLGIIGGGQLARMTALAALRLGCDVAVLERSADSPAARLAARAVTGDWNDPAVLLEFAQEVDALAIENEFVAAEALAVLEARGVRLVPRAATLGLVQDKLVQKSTAARAGLAVPRFAAVARPADVAEFAREVGLPVVLKTRRNGYDGKGNATIRSVAEIPEAWARLGGGEVPLYAEAWCAFVRELATIVTRSAEGATVVYPIVETVQRDHICHLVRAPAPIPVDQAARAADLARRAIAAVDGLGSWGVEMFLTADGEILLNELAPRVHNSGHYTIEACVCSQFENHVRAVLGWPLGSAAMVAPAAVMVNLLADAEGSGSPAGLREALAVAGAHVHLYGKVLATPGRKMGHVTALGATLAEAESVAARSASALSFSLAS